jgi:coproporphyrinogen III oxidase-like Fe-S oxidoreductase
VEEAKAALRIAAETFDRYTFDLIYARPRQTPAEWRAELSEGLALAGSHLSLYQLSIEPGTPYAALHAKGKLIVPDPDAALALYEVTQEMTAARGLPLYEISNHAAPGQQSRHNLIYWRYGEYAGIGPGAHGRILIPEGFRQKCEAGLPGEARPGKDPGSAPPACQGRATLGKRHATVTERKPEAWLESAERDGHGLTEQTALSPAEEADEMLLMGLRLQEGLDLARLASLTGLIPSAASIDELIDLQRLERLGNSRIRATPEGRFVLNALVAKLAGGMAPV